MSENEIKNENEFEKGTLISLSDGSRYLTKSSLHVVETNIIEEKPIQAKSLVTNTYIILNAKFILKAEEVYIISVVNDRAYYNFIPSKDRFLYVDRWLKERIYGL